MIVRKTLTIIIFITSVSYLVSCTKRKGEGNNPFSQSDFKTDNSIEFNKSGQVRVKEIDVKCDETDNMVVTLEFENLFNGIVYSQNYYNDTKCRYVNAGRNNSKFTFKVPVSGCGSRYSCTICSSVDNTLIIQSNEDVQQIQDSANKITCPRKEKQEKMVIFKPFMVEMLKVVQVPTINGGVECWMDILNGKYPNNNPLNETVKIGEQLTVLIYLRDPSMEYDVFVRDCYGYDTTNDSIGARTKLQLSDENGCSIQSSLFGNWVKIHPSDSNGATTLAYNILNTFKFRDRDQVYLKCSIELCNGKCEPRQCEVPLTTSNREMELPTESFNSKKNTLISPFEKNFGSINQTFAQVETIKILQHPSSVENMLASPQCYPGSIDSQCQHPTKQTSIEYPECPPGSKDNTCIQPNEDQNTQLPMREESTIALTECISNSRDSRCQQHRKPIPKGLLQCSPKSTDPRCIQTITIEEMHPKNPKHTTAVAQSPTLRLKNIEAERCFVGSLNPKCRNNLALDIVSTFSPSECYIGSSDSRCKSFRTTSKGMDICFLGSPDPKCLNNLATLKTNCFPSSTDRKCKPHTYLPPTTASFTHTPNCSPGSSDIRCQLTTISIPKVTSTQLTTLAPDCFPGSTNPECLANSTPTLSKTAETLLCNSDSKDPNCLRNAEPTDSPNCYPRSPDPRCTKIPATSHPNCFQGSTDRKCKPRTYLLPTTAPIKHSPGSSDIKCQLATSSIPKITSIQSTNLEPDCFDSKDPNCLRNAEPIDSPDCYPGSPDPRCTKTLATPDPNCFPGSTDRKCKPRIYLPLTIPSFTRTPNCSPGSLDIRCQLTTRPIPKVTSSQLTTLAPDCFPDATNPECLANSNPTITQSAGTLPCNSDAEDPNCLRNVETTGSPSCYPGSPDPKCTKISATSNQNCFPGASDRKCKTRTYLPPTTTPISRTHTSNCSPESLDIRCQLTNSFIPKVTSTQLTTLAPDCFPGSTNSKCLANSISTPTKGTTEINSSDCYPGSADSKCRYITKTTSIKSITTANPPQDCYSGSSDQRCQQIGRFPSTSSQCTPGNADPKCSITFKTTTPSNCHPGSLDKNCPNYGYQGTSKMPATYLPPLIKKAVFVENF